MVLRIGTFDNATGGNTLYKALTHPRAAQPGQALLAALADNAPVAIYDPGGAISAFAELFSLFEIEIAGVYVPQVERFGSRILDRAAELVPKLSDSGGRSVFVVAFDAERLIAQIEPYLPRGARVFSLDMMRIPPDRLTNRRAYLDPLNFATNFAFFRDTDALHTRLVTANYWSSYGADAVTCWMTLFGADGATLAEWCAKRGPGAGAIILDSREIRARFRLARILRPAVSPCGRSGRARCRQVRSRHLRRWRRRPGRRRRSVTFRDARRQCVAGGSLCGPPGAGTRRASCALGSEQPSDTDPARRDRLEPDGRRSGSAVC